jgi:uncharacterized protein YegL
MSLVDEDFEYRDRVRAEALLFLLVEHSVNFDAAAMDMVNKAVEQLICELSEIRSRWEVLVKIAALAFSSEPCWITAQGPVEAGQLNWEKLTAKGDSNFGTACDALNEKLSKKTLMQKLCGNSTPVIAVLSSGNYKDDWEKSASRLWDNNRFKNAWKLCFAIGENARTFPLARFTGTYDAVIEIAASDSCEAITRPIMRLIEKRYFIDDWFPNQEEELMKQYGVLDWEEINRGRFQYD